MAQQQQYSQLQNAMDSDRHLPQPTVYTAEMIAKL